MREVKFRAWFDGDEGMINFDEFPPEDMRYYAYLMQYTGLKDMYGKEIYEGDVLAQEDECDTIVKWENGKFGLHFDDVYTDFDDISSEYFWVVGNIYENPELLK